ncbi:MAG: UvrD-helicase domain-containing protein, partial [bacterium]
MRLDYDQSRAVSSRGDTVVSAGAGSGKTTVLTERYLSLLDEGVEVSAILTLTFTRKAAAEMHQRIYRALVSRSGENPRRQRALHEFDDARISTLDSFTAEIARAGAAELGIPPTFSADEQELDRICAQVATEFLFAHSNNGVLSRLASERNAEQLLTEGLKELAMREMSPVRPTDFEGMIEQQLRACRALVSNTVGELEDIVSFLRTEADPGKTKTTREIVGHATQTPALAELSLAELLDAVQWIADQSTPRSSKSENAQIIRNSFLAAKTRVYTLQECSVLLNAEAELRELYGLFSRLQEDVIARKRSSGCLSFEDVMELAIAVLEHSEPVRTWYRSRISHIMIDEFQDNNERQKYLLELLSGGEGVTGHNGDVGHDGRADGDRGANRAGELFFVGDEKQSIYRFRGADVSVFKRLSSELSGRGGQDITLRTNYRSAPRLIRRFNSLFSHLLEGGADYEAGFSPLFDR